ncbi:hypothetical protein D3C73_695600 [compost metagenome]
MLIVQTFYKVQAPLICLRSGFTIEELFCCNISSQIQTLIKIGESKVCDRVKDKANETADIYD